MCCVSRSSIEAIHFVLLDGICIAPFFSLDGWRMEVWLPRPFSKSDSSICLKRIFVEGMVPLCVS